jgi:hypothetical protein
VEGGDGGGKGVEGGDGGGKGVGGGDGAGKGLGGETEEARGWGGETEEEDANSNSRLKPPKVAFGSCLWGGGVRKRGKREH